jgi:hypothetical protein
MANSFGDAKRSNDQARASLRENEAQKDRASGKDPGGSDAEYQAKAAGRRWLGAGAFDKLAAKFRS